MFGYYRLASAVPQLRIADVDYNVDRLIAGFREASEKQAAAVVFPELSITGYSCGDLFFQPRLRQAALEGLRRFTEATEKSGTVAIVGLPFLYGDALYNTAAVVQAGRVLALVPKTMLPNYREFYEKRQFTSARALGTGTREITVNGAQVPFGTDIVFHDMSSPFSFGVEICEDLWSVIPPSSTLALLICARACRLLGRPASDILAVTMPGFGTTDRTRSNAVRMCRLLGAELREIPISDACLQHFRDIGHDPAERTTTYENVQARERTQILMDLANKTRGLVVGTGDLSEIALGWSTYNGDHMSMYAVNCSIPKTLIRCLIEHIAKESEPELAATLVDISNTPVSPELLPPSDDGTIEQRTEDVLGPYDLHDFFLFHFIKYGAPPNKILYLAEHAFRNEFQPEFIRRCLDIFIRRFFQQQFKRSCMPDGPKVGTISLSPRGDWRMPSDACGTIWTDQIS